MRDVFAMTDNEIETLFRKLRWPETDGQPVCPHCGSLESWELTNQKKFKCKEASCRKQFSITSGTVIAHHKKSFRDILLGVRAFTMPAKGLAATNLCKDVGCHYKSALIFEHKLREGMMHAMSNMFLNGVVEIDGCWVGGYIKPENVKINRVDRRLAVNRNGKRRVVVGMRERSNGDVVGRAIVRVFDQEGDATAWITERTSREATIMADEAPGWDDIHASHDAGRINHSERYAEGIVNTNQMESLFSRLRRLEVGTYHHISGPYLDRFATDTAWRENHRRMDDKARTHELLRHCLAAPQSRTFTGYWQQRGVRAPFPIVDDFFANFA